jgi:hypothetical protein
MKLDLSGTPAFGVGIKPAEPTSDERKQGLISCDDAFESLSKFFDRINITVWLMLDRLDATFPQNSELEMKGLRALFRTYLDLLPFRRIRLKIFLRDDIWLRITEGGFREASHISRTMNIVWSKDSLQNLVIRRALHNSAMCDYFGAEPNEILSEVEKQTKLFNSIFPEHITSKGRMSTIDWMLSRVADGTGKAAPRELIHLLQVARVKQLHAYELGAPELPGTTLIGQAAIQDSLAEVSKAKFELTLCAEHPSLKDYCLKMEHCKASQTLQTLCRILKVNEEQALAIAEEMVEAGFFEKRSDRGKQVYRVPFVYRDVLKMMQGNAD